ncbi:hypothetical protein KSC_093890 [Ktedonobacter sp. SOSP1-52]|uniref:hypothetical protein n=1 Tax=Ktedonobacter sp. SOSP1-52 TaxID=2778366 RepID=UPI00191590C6|nr:hypothetical protein [Ktedonobacter sp. SOSP1-52]GHO70497.1 hypothetical protein KSC_093890 [Ktedonobacter sp. SOSP1-52]
MAERRAEIERREEEKRARGELYYWNEANYKLLSLTQGEDAPELCFGATDYYTRLALHELYREVTDERERLRYCSNTFGVSLLIETRDQHLIFAQRSQRVGVYAGYYNISLSEGLSLVDGVDGRGPDLAGCGRRGIFEEYGIAEKQIEELTCLGLGIDRSYTSWGILGYARLKLESGEIAGHRAGAADAWEASHLDFVPTQLETVIDFVQSRGAPWAPSALTTIYQTLSYKYDEHTVLKVIEQRSR